ncbi:MAG: OB-fold domain-containing protein [Deltaproteobacteria bacterium]|nr:OB-fold domain-containing protein [Deltaproteobacteria bacterium]MBW2420116.1 OB-fold domain-containing protein [Deltaproteobacteria bacterium]
MGSPAKQVPIKEGLYTWPAAEPQLIGSRCRDCDEVSFPKQDGCPNCTSEATEEILLSRRGSLWTWTIQRFPPPAPPFIGERESFEPFGVGYIELPEGIRIESRLTVNDPAQLEIGMEMELCIEKFRDREDGTQLMTFAFAPACAEPTCSEPTCV